MTFVATLLILLATPTAEAPRGPVILDFTASWCGPCRQMKPALDALEAKGYPIQVVDIDSSPQIAKRYKVDRVPTFIVVDEKGTPLARTEGLQPARELARLYNDARAKTDDAEEERTPTEQVASPDQPEEPQEKPSKLVSEERREEAEGEPDYEESATFKNPLPWETVVRIKIEESPTVWGFGSGTVISSTPEESIILTCAHIFHLKARKQLHPSQFNRKISVDLFDGKLRGYKPAQVQFVESVPGQAIDYDFANDVGLIRIRPGRKLPASRVVPTTWTAREGIKMITVGCSQGHDATAWNTQILKAKTTLLNQEFGKKFSVIECQTAPIEGRSGGGLYTMDGYVAGVCDFADKQSNHGLYAVPEAIYALLDRNKLAMLYKPVTNNDRMIAQNQPAPQRRDPGSNDRSWPISVRK